MPRLRLVPALVLAVALCIVLFLLSSTESRDSWRRLPQQVGLGEHVAPVAHEGKASAKDPDYANWNPRPVFKEGTPMPPGHNYTSVLVLAKTKDENVDWVYEKMPDQPVSVYVADDPSAPQHVPKNKGHEVMIYLTWIIDNYDNLPDVTIFMHAHQSSWHNDDLLSSDSELHVRLLNRQRVWRQGFVNMRCSWSPGCPNWIHPGNTDKDGGKEEEHLSAKSWSELFPLDEVPKVLAQPCCAQFALSRDRIQARPHAQYVWYRDWLFNTKLPDHLSGRIWEYVWQFVFTGENIYCPKESVCYCDQYSICFGGEEGYADYNSVRNELGDREGDLRSWEEHKRRYIGLQATQTEAGLQADGPLVDPTGQSVDPPDEGKGEELRKEIDRLRPLVDKLRYEANERGKDPKNRALEAGREWHEGDEL